MIFWLQMDWSNRHLLVEGIAWEVTVRNLQPNKVIGRRHENFILLLKQPHLFKKIIALSRKTSTYSQI